MRKTYIAGVAETQLGKVPDQSELSMAAMAAREALSEAGLRLNDVDALFTNYMGEEGSVQLGEYLGIHPRYAESSDMGGAAFEFFVHHAMLAVSSGHCEVALIAYASRQRSRKNRIRSAEADNYSLMGQFETPYGAFMPITQYALHAARHMFEFGTTPEHLAHVAVSARKWASLNPKAFRRDELTIEDVMASQPISEPLRKLDCCLVTDGGGAIVVVGQSRARDARKKAIRIIGAGESHRAWHSSQAGDLTRTPGRESARDAFARAGVTPADVDLFQPYDNFTSSVVMQLEDVGFCQKGEGGEFVAAGNTEPGGRLPTSTSGGGLSYCHPGALGILLLIETVRQLRGETGERQVPDARIGVAHGIGGTTFSTSATVVLARD